MPRKLYPFALIISCMLQGGCVERRFVVNTDPPGAVVMVNGKPIGQAPADDHFVYYGNYHLTLVKDGYATMQVDQKLKRPWYEYFPLEIVSEILWPFRIEDVHHFAYRLEPLPAVKPEEMLSRAQVLRNRGQTIGAPVEATAQSVDPEQPPTSGADAKPAPIATKNP